MLPLDIRIAACWTLLCPDWPTQVVLITQVKWMLLLIIVRPRTLLTTTIIWLSGQMLLSHRLMEAHYPITAWSSIEFYDSSVYILLKGTLLSFSMLSCLWLEVFWGIIFRGVCFGWIFGFLLVELTAFKICHQILQVLLYLLQRLFVKARYAHHISRARFRAIVCRERGITFHSLASELFSEILSFHPFVYSSIKPKEFLIMYSRTMRIKLGLRAHLEFRPCQLIINSNHIVRSFENSL